MLRKPQNTPPPREEYINYLEPILSKFGKPYKNSPWTTARNHTIAVLIACAIATTVMFFLPLPGLEWVWITVGVLLGMVLFIPAYFMVAGWTDTKRQEDSDYLSLKEKYSPGQRLRVGSIAFVITLIVTVVLLGSIPSIAGGIVVVAATLGIYAFVQRTKEEFDAFIEGEIDPRDIPDEIEDEDPETDTRTDEQKLREAKEYIELVNSLPEEQRAVLLNPRLNGLISVADEDDIKKNKRGFGKKGK